MVMQTFETPEAISVNVEFAVGHLRIVAGARADTVVDVRPTNPARKSDVRAAEQTRVDFAGGRLSIKAPKGWRIIPPFGGGDSIDVTIELPAGSNVRAAAAVATFDCTGRLGECDLRTSAGDVHVAESGAVQVKTSTGDIRVERASGDAELVTSSGAVRLDRVDGAAVVKNSNGDTWIGEVAGAVRVNAANGKIAVDQAHAAVTAKTANGDVRLGDVASGAVVALTARGKVDIGVHDGVAAWLDLSTSFGRVHSDLDAAERPGAGVDSVEIRARSAFGDITIRRAPAVPAGR
jgi:DUF4097 and DUF4098 domain-containing protein YvlB